jgi:integrase
MPEPLMKEEDIAAYLQLSKSSVARVAIEEWRMLERHPMRGVHKPANSKPRERLPSGDEIERLRFVMGDSGETIVSRVFLVFLFAIETGMRLGEIVALENVSGAVATLIMTKNGDTREVPLSPAAQALWAAHGPFRITGQQADIHFRKSVTKAGIDDLHFHDSRHLAITRLAQKMHIFNLARAVGIRNLKQLMTYYNKPASEIAEMLK